VVLVLAAILLAVYSHQRLYPMIVSGPGTPDPTGAAPASTPLPTGAFWVENYRLTEMWSGPAGDDGVVSFGTTSSQFCSFLVVRPQDNPRLYVLNPYSNNYLWIDAEAVGPVPPPEHGAEPPPADQNCTAAIVP
jgi:hypothetical protein